MADLGSITDNRNSATAICAERTLLVDSVLAESRDFSATARFESVDCGIVVEEVVVDDARTVVVVRALVVGTAVVDARTVVVVERNVVVAERKVVVERTVVVVERNVVVFTIGRSDVVVVEPATVVVVVPDDTAGEVVVVVGAAVFVGVGAVVVAAATMAVVVNEPTSLPVES
jgi:hypothetical protein